MSKREKNIIGFIYIIIGAIVLSCLTNFIMNIFNYLKPNQNLKGLFSDIFAMICIAYIGHSNFPTGISNIEDVRLLLKGLKKMLIASYLFIAILTILQVGYLFGGYEVFVPPYLYIASILFLPFVIWAKRYLTSVLKANQYSSIEES
ncbi:hypothetical protein [Pedobacter sp. Leaf170]|uniref:hypothetical protein n=1 Tax=Pedobacter sp. Leaf170 TaxID=2876558 RepID=UPI001E611D18|nr:hypothetical protein [Pedobacter sp. Leaf170]